MNDRSEPGAEWSAARAQARALLKAGDGDAASRLIAAHGHCAPRPWSVDVEFAQIELARKAPAAARAALERAEKAGMPRAGVQRLTIRILLAEDRPEDALELALCADLDKLNLSVSVLTALSQAALDRGEPAQAEALADRAIAKNPAHRKSYNLKYEAALLVLGKDELLDGMQRRIFVPGGAEGHTLGLRKLFRLCPVEPERLKEFLREAKRRWPDSKEVKEVSVLASRSDLLGENWPKSPSEQFEAIRVSIAREVSGNPDRSRIAHALSGISPKMLTRPILLERPENPIVSEDSGTGKVAIPFWGIGRRPHGGLHLTDAHLSAAGYSAIVLQDPDYLLLLNGVRGLDGGLEGTLELLRDKIALFGEDAVVTTVGISGGGLPALLYGLKLGASRILCFSGPTNVNRAFLKQIGDKRAESIQHRIEREVPPERRAMRLLVKNVRFPPRIDMIYGAENGIDRGHAEDLAGAPGVTLYPLAGVAEHLSFNWVRDRGLLPAVLNGDMSGLTGAIAPDSARQSATIPARTTAGTR